MFTGIVRAVGRVQKTAKKSGVMKLVVETPPRWGKLSVGESIAVNGVCLTVVKQAKHSVTLEVVPETLNATNLGRLKPASLVNLEPALRAGDSLGGHFVMGHVDGVGRIRKIRRAGRHLSLQVEAPGDIIRYVVRKGSIALEGISLTVQNVDAASFEVAVIPHTLENTNLRHKSVGDQVNLETDFLAKIVENFVKPLSSRPKVRVSRLSEKFLREQGFSPPA
jgi:riboflavin synthase